MKCGIIYKKIAMRTGDDERRINYEWPNKNGLLLQLVAMNMYGKQPL